MSPADCTAIAPEALEAAAPPTSWPQAVTTETTEAKPLYASQLRPGESREAYTERMAEHHRGKMRPFADASFPALALALESARAAQAKEIVANTIDTVAQELDDDNADDLNVAWMAELTRYEETLTAVLDVPVTTPAESVEKVAAFFAGQACELKPDGELVGPMIGEEPALEAFQALWRDMQALAGGGQPAARTPAPDEQAHARWQTALRRWEQAHAAAMVTQAERMRLSDIAAERYPEPDPEICIKDGAIPRAIFPALLESGEMAKSLKNMPAIVVERMRAKVEAYAAEKARIDAEVGLEEADALDEAAWELTNEMEKELVRTPACDMASVLKKLVHVWDYESLRDLENPAAVSEMLSSEDAEQWGKVLLYRDMVRLSGGHSATMDVETFDAAAFVAQWETIPFCSASRHGLCFDESADQRFMVTEPKALEAYRQHTRDMHPELADEYERTRPAFWTGPFDLQQREAIAWAYPHDSARRAQLKQSWDQRNANHRAVRDALGSLAAWQKRLVGEECRRLVARRDQELGINALVSAADAVKAQRDEASARKLELA